MGASDVRGVASDKFGNIWYSAEPDEPYPVLIGAPIFYISTNKGIDFNLIDTSSLFAPAPANTFYDFPQICFGADENGNYGLYCACTVWSFVDYDAYPTLTFIPINGHGIENINIAGGTFAALPGLVNCNYAANITASKDGRLWSQGFAGSQLPPFTTKTPISLLFKSPGPLDQNYAGAWQTVMVNNVQFYFADDGFSTESFSTQSSQPIWGYWMSAQSILYDDKREALYSITAAQNPDESENMRIYFIISRDNGQTWSAPIDINSTNFANRGFQSMALDEITGDLVFGWYDGRNDPTFQSIQYFGDVIPAKRLDKLVQKIPHSNPLNVIPTPVPPQ